MMLNVEVLSWKDKAVLQMSEAHCIEQKRRMTQRSVDLEVCVILGLFIPSSPRSLL